MIGTSKQYKLTQEESPTICFIQLVDFKNNTAHNLLSIDLFKMSLCQLCFKFKHNLIYKSMKKGHSRENKGVS